MKRIVWGVIIAHGCLILSLCVHHLLGGEKKRSHIIVRTVRAPLVASSGGSSPAKEKVAPPKPKAQKKAPEKPLEKPKVVKKQEKKPLEKVVEASLEKKIEAPLEAKGEIEESLLKEIAQEFAEIEKPKTFAPKKNALAVPSVSERLAIVSSETIDAQGDAHYGDLLIAFLQSMLSLPEKGVVKMELEVDGEGRLVRCEIVDAQSQKNSEFLKKQLPELNLPCFNGKPNETFVCTVLFKNS